MQKTIMARGCLHECRGGTGRGGEAERGGTGRDGAARGCGGGEREKEEGGQRESGRWQRESKCKEGERS